MAPRSVTLVLATPQGRLLGQTDAFDVELPWWQEVHDVVAAARRRLGADVIVLRLLASERAHPPGGWVAYLAETDAIEGLDLQPVSDELAHGARQSSPRRAAWALPGGHRESLDWVRRVWPRGGAFRAGQRRAWNLSSLWQLQPDDPGAAPTAWLKQIPPFLGHEPAVLRWLQATLPGVAPAIVASDDTGRMLLEHVPGDDAYGAAADAREHFARLLHRVQCESIPAVASLARQGVPDRREHRLAEPLRSWLSGHLAALPRTARFLDQLDDHLARVAQCALPDVLVHGDYHPGNVRVDGSRATILDWGDSFLGNPAFDLLRLTEGVAPQAASALTRCWASLWKQHDARCEPERAVALLRPLVPLRAAATYACFVAHIEESEHPFHATDVTEQLQVAERAIVEAERADGEALRSIFP